MPKNSPIGIFDSGIGGLTVAKAIHDLLPNESLVYFGDTAHLPYGDKSAASVRKFSLRIARFLLENDCKMIVIACNTASARGARAVAKWVGKEVPVINVIDPIAQHVAQHFHGQKIGVIATKGTVNSRVYPRRIHAITRDVEVSTRATPLLAPMIEEGFFNNNISKAVIHSYLDNPSLMDIKGLILGCTHYPLIKREVSAFYKGSVDVMDSSLFVAGEVVRTLDEKGLRCQSDCEGKLSFYVSDFTDSFRQSAGLFFGERIDLQEARIWD
ncbi:MAG: glutamate racemase [Flavobacteriales bacterium]|nr:glutamate racemase [Flavobacteriales bacterium]